MSVYGFVYVLFNPSMPGLLKIGCTNRAPNERARELSAPSGVPTCFHVMAYFEVEDCHQAERAAHAKFHGFRICDDREFFRLPMPDLKELFEFLSADSLSQFADQRILRYHKRWCIDLGMASEYEPVEAANA